MCIGPVLLAMCSLVLVCTFVRRVGVGVGGVVSGGGRVGLCVSVYVIVHACALTGYGVCGSHACMRTCVRACVCMSVHACVWQIALLIISGNSSIGSALNN